MTLKSLPEVKALDGLKDQKWSLREDAIGEWNPGISAADSDETTITIYDVIGEDFWTGEGVTSKRIAGALRKIGNRSITVNVNSPGGDFFEGVAIYNLLKEHEGEVTVRVMGLAASAASVIAMAGDRIEIAETGFMMLHNAWTIVVGNRHDLSGMVDTLQEFDGTMANLYAKASGAENEVAVKWMDDETWFNGTAAVEAGLADSFLPGDTLKEDESPDDKASLRASLILDSALKQSNPNMTRSERRALLKDVKSGKPSAATNGTSSAAELVQSLKALETTITS